MKGPLPPFRPDENAGRGARDDRPAVGLSTTDRRRISVKAVIIGALTDLVGSLAAMTIVGPIVRAVLGADGVPQEELELQMHRPGFLAPSMLLGLGFTALGGFVAGRISGQLEVVHGAIVGAACLVVGILLWPLSAPASPWYTAVSLLGCVPLGLLGGYLAAMARSERIS